MTILAGLAAVLIVAAGCVSTVNDRKTSGVPFVKDKVEGMYERPVTQVFAAAKTVVSRNGTLVNETTLYNQTNDVRTVQGKINQANVWVRITGIQPKLTTVVVQTRGKGGSADLDLAHEVEKQIALELVK